MPIGAERQVETAIDIAATPADVWEVLTDFAGYARWNPFIIDAGGTARPGRRLVITLKPPGARAMTIRPTVLVADPGRALRWRGKVLVPGIFDGEHYFKLETADEGCHFVHGEQFSGLLVGLFASSFFANVQRGFEAMNRALKAKLEAATAFHPRSS